MQKTSPTIWVILSALIIITTVYFGILPLNKQLKDLRLQVGIKAEESTALTTKVATLTQLQTQFAAQSADLKRLQLALPKDAKAEEIFFMLTSITNNAGVTLANIQPDQTSNTSTVGTDKNTADMTVSVTGDFNAMTKFTDLLNKNARPIVVKTVTLASQDSKDGKAPLAGTYKLGFLIAPSVSASADSVSTTPKGEI